MKTIFSQQDLLKKVKPLMEQHGQSFRKKTNVLAKMAKGGEKVETVTSDGLETTNTAEAGDFLVRNQTRSGEMYVISQDAFHQKYQYLEEGKEGFAKYRPTGMIQALELTSEISTALGIDTSPFYFMANWGEEIVAKPGDYLVIPDGGEEVYRIAKQEFWETYEPAA